MRTSNKAKRKMAPYFIVNAPYSWSRPGKAILAFGDGTGIAFTAARLMGWKRDAEMWRESKVQVKFRKRFGYWRHVYYSETAGVGREPGVPAASAGEPEIIVKVKGSSSPGVIIPAVVLDARSVDLVLRYDGNEIPMDAQEVALWREAAKAALKGIMGCSLFSVHNVSKCIQALPDVAADAERWRMYTATLTPITGAAPECFIIDEKASVGVKAIGVGFMDGTRAAITVDTALAAGVMWDTLLKSGTVMTDGDGSLLSVRIGDWWYNMPHIAVAADLEPEAPQDTRERDKGHNPPPPSQAGYKFLLDAAKVDAERTSRVLMQVVTGGDAKEPQGTREHDKGHNPEPPFAIQRPTPTPAPPPYPGDQVAPSGAPLLDPEGPPEAEVRTLDVEAQFRAEMGPWQDVGYSEFDDAGTRMRRFAAAMISRPGMSYDVHVVMRCTVPFAEFWAEVIRQAKAI